MKKLLFALLACSLATACSLDEKILASSTQETYYKTVEQCITGLISATSTTTRNTLLYAKGRATCSISTAQTSPTPF